LIAQARLGPPHPPLHALARPGRAAHSTCCVSARCNARLSQEAGARIGADWIADSAAEMAAGALDDAPHRMGHRHAGRGRGTKGDLLIKFFGREGVHDVIDRAIPDPRLSRLLVRLPLEEMYRHAVPRACTTAPTRCTAYRCAADLAGYQAPDGIWRGSTCRRGARLRSAVAALLEAAVTDA